MERERHRGPPRETDGSLPSELRLGGALELDQRPQRPPRAGPHNDPPAFVAGREEPAARGEHEAPDRGVKAAKPLQLPSTHSVPELDRAIAPADSELARVRT